MRISDWSSDVCSSDLLALAVDDVKTAGDDDRGARQRILAGHVTPQDEGDQRRPEKLGIVERHQGGDRCISERDGACKLDKPARDADARKQQPLAGRGRSEEHTSELQSLMRISYAVFCLQKKKHLHNPPQRISTI